MPSTQALFKEVSPDASGRETNEACRNIFTNCRPSRTAGIVQEYARNNTVWHKDFGDAYQILLEHGYPANHLVQAGTTLPELIDPVVVIPPSETPSPPTQSSSSPPSRPSSPPPRPSSPPSRPRPSSPSSLAGGLETDAPSNEQVEIDVTIALVTVIIVIFGIFLLVLTLFL